MVGLKKHWRNGLLSPLRSPSQRRRWQHCYSRLPCQPPIDQQKICDVQRVFFTKKRSFEGLGIFIIHGWVEILLSPGSGKKQFKLQLVGGWTNPFDKYESKWWNLPPSFGGEHKNIFELPPPSLGMFIIQQLGTFFNRLDFQDPEIGGGVSLIKRMETYSYMDPMKFGTTGLVLEFAIRFEKILSKLDLYPPTQ